LNSKIYIVLGTKKDFLNYELEKGDAEFSEAKNDGSKKVYY